MVDTNAAFISQEITAAGAQVLWRTTVGDNVEQITEAIARALQRAELVITTGGLGPTVDDLTKKAICKYFKRPLIFYDNILKTVEERFKRRGLVMPAINQNQALQPQGAEFIENERGSAVGIVISEGERLFMALPGVPDEMEAMVTGYIAQAIRKRSGGLVTIHRKLRTVGIIESALNEKIADLIDSKNSTGDKISVAFLPSWRGLDLRLTIAARNAARGQKQIAALEQKITERIGEYVFAYDDETLPQAIGRLLKEKGLRLAVAESCTGGLLGKLITDVAGSSDYFVGGIIVYSNELKTKLLGVPPELLERHGAVSRECAAAMADSVIRATGADVGVSITGVAGPSGGTPEKPVGLVYIGIGYAGKTTVGEFNYGAGRERNRERSATSALDMIRKALLGRL